MESCPQFCSYSNLHRHLPSVLCNSLSVPKHSSSCSVCTPAIQERLISYTWKAPSKCFLPSKEGAAVFPVKSQAVKSSKGFGALVKQSKKTKKKKVRLIGAEDDEGSDQEEEDDDDSSDVIPEIVTNRMMKRMGVFVGLPVATGLLFFPAFYYMKVFLKWNVPDWLPFITSALVFGSAALGITYGIVSSSWDPLREGSLLGWTEAQRNWPVFWESVWDRSGKKKR